MHTETDYTRTEAFIAAHRARIAVALGATLAVLVTLAWALLAPVALGIHAPTLALCVGIIATLGSAVAALAFYWSAE